MKYEHEIQVNETDEPVFENDSAVAVRSNNLKSKTLVGSYTMWKLVNIC